MKTIKIINAVVIPVVVILILIVSYTFVTAETKGYKQDESTKSNLNMDGSIASEHKQQVHDHDHDDEDKHDEHGDEDKHNDEHDHEETPMVKLTKAQQQIAGIRVNQVKAINNLKQTISAPGEVVNDLYHTTLLSTQINSKVLKRQVILGQHVSKGDVIAILYSLDIATAQSQLKVSIKEWQRVEKLGKKTVGEKRFIEAKSALEKDKSLLIAYGFNKNLLAQFLLGKQTYHSGEYPILAPHNGVILEDNFQSGQFLEAGTTIARLVNEDNIWVEALLAPELGQTFPVGTKAKVIIGLHNFDAKVIHDSHAIDEITRTRKIRLNIKNKGHLLHAGLFATVYIELPINEAVILLPESALMRSSEGDWTVFVEEKPGIFKQQEVEIDKTINGLNSIKGLHSGERVAIKGAFFLTSELAKGGFDPHNH